MTVLFFARSREITGTPDTVVELEAGMQDFLLCCLGRPVGCLRVKGDFCGSKRGSWQHTTACRLLCCLAWCVAVATGATSQDLLKLLLQQYPQLHEITGVTPCCLANPWPSLQSLCETTWWIECCKSTGACVLALNHEYLAQDERQALKEGDEVAVIPPISGG